MNAKPKDKICDDALNTGGDPSVEASRSVMPDWYDQRHELEPEMVFQTRQGDIVKLDCRVPGDGTLWEVADWDGRWGYWGGKVEPSDLIGAAYNSIEDFLSHNGRTELRG